ncbi:DUF1707 SHOCT-like domain-containing protein [Auraticoccus monumenti]|uniref:DUF1707 domain-containing protein n=1 Tax=Auraticoccus monumenti TaxID=675864 RepID=A0A1G7EJY4_9ACTN|nr:DUF1707 domain-containing protein [Auraticoccus monumenti]SDE64009.1 protein of unknown function [Auraticoccus monumenti]
MTISLPPSPHPSSHLPVPPAPPVPAWARQRSWVPVTVRRPGPPPGLRVGDAERSRVCDELSQHFSLGRLDGEELEERLNRAMSARTAGDLARLTRDLPADAPRPHAAPLPVPAQRSSASAVVAVLVLVGSLMTCFLMITASLLISPGWAVGALVGGTVAAAGGVAIGHLWHWWRQ